MPKLNICHEYKFKVFVTAQKKTGVGLFVFKVFFVCKCFKLTAVFMKRIYHSVFKIDRNCIESNGNSIENSLYLTVNGSCVGRWWCLGIQYTQSALVCQKHTTEVVAFDYHQEL